MAGEDVDPKSSASAAAVPYVFLLFLLDVMTQFCALVSALHMIGSTSYMQLHPVSVLDVFSSSSYMQMLFTFTLSDCMTYFISAILVMLYLVFSLTKLFGKLLIFPTVRSPRGPSQVRQRCPSTSNSRLNRRYDRLARSR